MLIESKLSLAPTSWCMSEKSLAGEDQDSSFKHSLGLKSPCPLLDRIKSQVKMPCKRKYDFTWNWNSHLIQLWGIATVVLWAGSCFVGKYDYYVSFESSCTSFQMINFPWFWWDNGPLENIKNVFCSFLIRKFHKFVIKVSSRLNCMHVDKI